MRESVITPPMGKIFKVILCGDGRVGKTTFRKQYLGDTPKKDYMMTIGADFAVKKTEIDDETYTLQIWDLAGQPRFSAIRDKYYQAASGMLLMFDLTMRESYDNIPNWLSEYMKNTDKDIIPMVLIGNKSDIIDKADDYVKDEEVESYIKELNAWGKNFEDDFHVDYIKTSALTDVNVDAAFEQLINKMLKKNS